MANKIEFVVLGDVKDLEDKLAGTKKQFDALGKNAGLVFAGLTASAYGFVEAARIQEGAINQLNQALKNNGNFTENASKEYIKYAEALQKQSLFGDEQIIQAQALIASYGLEGDSLKALTKVTLDLAQAKGIDLKSAADLVAKSVGSSTNALARYGIEISGAAGSTTRAASAVSEITRLYGGQAEASTKGLGATIQLKNAMSDLAEDIGTALAPKVIELTKGLNSLVDVARQHPEIAKFTAEMVILGIQISAVLIGISLLGKASIALAGTMALLNGQIFLVGNTLFTLGTALKVVGGLGIAAFVGWKVGELITQLTGLDAAMVSIGKHLGDLEARKKLGSDYVSEEEFARNKEIWAARAAALQQATIDQQEHENAVRQAKQETVSFMTDAEEQLKLLAAANTSQDIQAVTDKFQQERDQLLAHLDLKMQILADRGLLEVSEKERIEAEKAAIVVKYNALQMAAEDKRVSNMSEAFKKTQFIRKKEVEDVGTTLANLASLNKTAARIAQVISLGRAIVNTALGVTTALARGDFVSAGLIAIAGGIEIATIASQQFAKGTSGVTEDSMAQVSKNEIIVPTTFSEAIKRGELTLGGPGSSSGGGNTGGSIIFDFTGAQFNGVTDTLVKEIFTKASENIANRTLAFRGAI